MVVRRNYPVYLICTRAPRVQAVCATVAEVCSVVALALLPRIFGVGCKSTDNFSISLRSTLYTDSTGIHPRYLITRSYLPRYSAFWILYPVGAGSEAFVMFSTVPTLSKIFTSAWNYDDYLRFGLFLYWWPGTSHISSSSLGYVGPFGARSRLRGDRFTC